MHSAHVPVILCIIYYCCSIYFFLFFVCSKEHFSIFFVQYLGVTAGIEMGVTAGIDLFHCCTTFIQILLIFCPTFVFIQFFCFSIVHYSLFKEKDSFLILDCILQGF